MDTDVESKTTAVQLLNTLDSCIADNGMYKIEWFHMSLLWRPS